MFWRTLNGKFRNLMRNHELSDEELRKASDDLKSTQQKVFIGYVIGMLILVGLFIWHIIEQYYHPTNTDPFYVTVLGAIILIIVAGVFFYFITMGIIKIQFNNELKKDYPHLYDEIKL